MEEREKIEGGRGEKMKGLGNNHTNKIKMGNGR